MKIREQAIDNFEFKPRFDKKVGAPFPRLQCAFSGRRFQYANAGCAHRDDSPARPPTPLDCGDGSLPDAAIFPMHSMLLQIFGSDRSKGADADVQSNGRDLDAPVDQPFEQRGGKRVHIPPVAIQRERIRF